MPRMLAAVLLTLAWQACEAAVRGHGALKRPQFLDNGEPAVNYIDTSLCFDASPSVVLTHVELYLVKEVAEGVPFTLTIYEAPRFGGDVPTHPLDARMLTPQKPWLHGQPGRFLHEQQLQVPGGKGRQMIQLKTFIRLQERPVCCGFRLDSRLVVPYETWDVARRHSPLPWLPVLWAPAESEERETCGRAEFNPFNTPRVMAWAIHFEPVGTAHNIVDLDLAMQLPDCGMSPRQAEKRDPSSAKDVDALGMWPVATGARATLWQEACRLAATDDTAFATFRQATKSGNIGIISDPFAQEGPLTTGCMLREILEDERTSVAQGIGELLWRTAPDVNEPISTVGSPMTVEIGGRNIPDDLLWPLVMLKWLAGRFGSLRGFDIVEVGAGFGGLASMVLRTFAVRSYNIVDLPEVQMLQQRFLSAVGPRERFADKANFISAGLPKGVHVQDRYDLFISVNAFSELSIDMQERYFEELILRSDRGFIVDNRYTAAFAGGRQLDMHYAGLTLVDRLLASGFYVEAKTWQAMLPTCETCSPLNMVIFYELRRIPPCHTTSPSMWPQKPEL